MKHRIWKTLLALRFRLFQRHRYRTLVIEYIYGFPLVVLPDVFNPALFPTGKFLAEQYSKISPHACVLDMGTGSGIGAILSAQYAKRITAVDINPEAVRCATINVLLNHLENRIKVHQSNLFSALDNEKFDVVLFNPPFFQGKPKDLEDHAWRGVDVVERFLRQLSAHLTPEGYALIVLSSNSDFPEFHKLCYSHNLTVEIHAQRDEISEIFTVYRVGVQ